MLEYVKFEITGNEMVYMWIHIFMNFPFCFHDFNMIELAPSTALDDDQVFIQNKTIIFKQFCWNSLTAW